MRDLIGALYRCFLDHYPNTIFHYSGENPIPYDVAGECSEAKTGLYQSLPQTMASGPFTLMPLTENACRDYSFQLVYEKFEGTYPPFDHSRPAISKQNFDHTIYHSNIHCILFVYINIIHR